MVDNSKVPLEDIDLDSKSEWMMKCIFERGGETNTSEIKKETGLQNQSIHYRYEKLSDYGLISTRKADSSGGGRLPPTIVMLTERGEEGIRKGLIGDIFDDEGERDEESSVELSYEQFEEFEREIRRLENRVNALQSSVDDVVSTEGEMNEDVDMRVVKARFDELSQDVDTLEDEVSGIREDLDNVREKINNLVVPYVRVFRSVFKERGLDVDAKYKEMKKKMQD